MLRIVISHLSLAEVKMNENNKPIIYIDMDGVLVDFESALTKVSPEMLCGRIRQYPGHFRADGSDARRP